MVSDPSMTGSEDPPTCTIWVSDSWVPSKTTEVCRTVLVEKVIPGLSRAPGLIAAAIATPMMIPVTGPPTIGKNLPNTVATAAMAVASASPGSLVSSSGHRAGRTAGWSTPTVVDDSVETTTVSVGSCAFMPTSVSGPGRSTVAVNPRYRHSRWLCPSRMKRGLQCPPR